MGSSRGRPKGRNKAVKALLWAAVAVGIACVSMGVAHATGIVNVTEIAETVPDLLQAEVEEDLNTDEAWGTTPDGVQCFDRTAIVASTSLVGVEPSDHDLAAIKWCEAEHDRRVALQDEQRGPLLEIAARMDEMDYVLDDDTWDIFNTVYWCLEGDGLDGARYYRELRLKYPDLVFGNYTRYVFSRGRIDGDSSYESWAREVPYEHLDTAAELLAEVEDSRRRLDEDC